MSACALWAWLHASPANFMSGLSLTDGPFGPTMSVRKPTGQRARRERCVPAWNWAGGSPSPSFTNMKQTGVHRAQRITGKEPSKTRLATNVPSYAVTFHTATNSHPDATTSKAEERYVENPSPTRADGPPLPFQDSTEEAAGAVPTYESTTLVVTMVPGQDRCTLSLTHLIWTISRRKNPPF
ncbi:hypothetical protein B0H10DRAFT_1939246 [Mycena sp. CBHHK59/15]|nr:hypothetical protein B0H10DRAFT_1939246 [Mycena sp. CBHHK59/15]